jgi:hypothetical protein
MHLHSVPQQTNRPIHQFPEFDGLSCFDIVHSKNARGLSGTDTRLNYSVCLSRPIWKKLRQLYGLPLRVERQRKKRKPLCQRDFSEEDDSEDNDDSVGGDTDQSNDKDEGDEGDIGDSNGKKNSDDGDNCISGDAEKNIHNNATPGDNNDTSGNSPTRKSRRLQKIEV